MANNKKFYAVKVGKVPGVYTTWAECQSSVEHFPGAKYKSFPTEAEALEFVYGKKEDNSTYEGVIAYVDGSFDLATFRYSYGVAIIDEDKEIHLSGTGDDPEMAKMRNVAGEIMGAMAAMQYAKNHGLEEIMIVHDYSGLSEWCLKNWKCNLDGTRNFVKFYDEVSKSVKIRFQKVKGHSGDKYNDLVDALAKKALGIEIKKSLKEYIADVARRNAEE